MGEGGPARVDERLKEERYPSSIVRHRQNLYCVEHARPKRRHGEQWPKLD